MKACYPVLGGKGAIVLLDSDDQFFMWSRARPGRRAAIPAMKHLPTTSTVVVTSSRSFVVFHSTDRRTKAVTRFSVTSSLGVERVAGEPFAVPGRWDTAAMAACPQAFLVQDKVYSMRTGALVATIPYEPGLGRLAMNHDGTQLVHAFENSVSNCTGITVVRFNMGVRVVRQDVAIPGMRQFAWGRVGTVAFAGDCVVLSLLYWNSRGLQRGCEREYTQFVVMNAGNQVLFCGALTHMSAPLGALSMYGDTSSVHCYAAASGTVFQIPGPAASEEHAPRKKRRS